MSKQQQETITCPRCGHKQETTVWQSVNVTLDKEQRNRLLTGDFFRFECDECQYNTMLTYPCLYHDMDRKLMVYLVPDYTPEKLAEMNADFDETKEMIQLNGYEIRIVSNSNELVEKVKINDAGKDDRLVEVCKLMLEAQFAQDHPDFKVDQALFDHDDQGDIIILLDYDGRNKAFNLDPRLYELVENNLAADMPENRIDCYEAINREWAQTLMGEAE